MSTRIYPGTSAFFANRTKPNDNHSWLVNNARPILTLTHTGPDGRKSFTDLFLNKNVAAAEVTGKNVVITFPVDAAQPIFRILDQVSGRTQA